MRNEESDLNIVHVIMYYRYVGLSFLLALEYFVLFLPGETELTAAGILVKNPAYHMNVISIIVASGIGTFVGGMMAYGVGRLLGRPFIMKYGKFIFLTQARIEQSELLFERYTILTVVISRYVAFVRDIVPYVAGVNRVKVKVFAPVLFVSSFLWVASFVFAGEFLVQAWKWARAYWKTEWLPMTIGVVIIFLLVRVFHRTIKNFVNHKRVT